jgi:PAS domain S-box-containing protein
MGVHKPNGTLTWISINSQPLFRQGEPQPYAVVTSFSDITARKQAETALRNSEALYRAIVEDQVELVCRFLPDGTLTFVNDAYCRVLGISREDLLGDRYKMFLMALDRETTIPLTASTDVNNPVSWLEHQVILPNGDICWQQWNSRAIFDEQGNFIEFQAVGRDITERKRMENMLRQTTERLNGILRSLDDVVWSITSDLATVFYVSPAAETLYGYPQVAFHDNPQLWLDVIHPQDKPQIAAVFSGISTTWGLQTEYRIIRPDGAVRWVYDRAWLIRDEHGQANRIDRIVSDVTERKQAEAELRLREARYALAVRAGQVGVWDWHLETGDLYMDSNLKEMLGFEDQEIQNYLDSWRQLVHPDDFETVMAVANKHLEGTLPGYQIEHRMLRKDGSIRWFLARGVGFQDREGKPYRLMGTNTDITDRKLAEEELRRQHLRSQLLAEVTLRIRQSLRLEEILHTTVTEIQKLLQADRILIYRIDANGPGVVVEEAVVPGYQITLGQNISDPCFTVDYMEQYRQGRISAIANVEDSDLQPCHADFLKQFDVKANLVVPILVGSQESGVRSQKEWQLEGKGGEAIHLVDADTVESSTLEPAAIAPAGSSTRPKSQALNPQPSLWGLLIAHQCSQPRQWSDFEVELLKQLADQVAIALAQSQLLESLQESEERFYGAFEYAAIGMALVGLDGRWLQVNPALCQIVGYSEAELLTTTLRSLTHPDDADSDGEHVQKILAGEIRFYQIEKRYIHQQGQSVWVLLSVSLVRDVQGQPLYFVTQIQDITKRKQAEEEILKALEKEKELNELKSRFVSMISHEFRTPLTTIQSASELLEHYEWTAKQKQERFQQIHVAVQHMAQLLEDVLLIGKAEAGKLKINPELVDLVNFCQTLMADLQFTTSGNYKFMFISSAVQQAAWIDPKLLRQILNNLLLNAIKYSPDGGNISLELIYRNNSVTFRIRDEGIGIPPNDRERLFEAFYRATNVDTIQGTGLGLAIVKKCVDLYKGQIALESEIGVGTTFTVTLPLSHPN